MLEVLNKASQSYEKFAIQFLEEMINVAQSFTVVLLIDESWQELFNPEIFLLDGKIELDLYISKNNTINTFIEKHDNINYFVFIWEDSEVLLNEKLKIKIPISNIMKIVLDNGFNNTYLSNPVHVKVNSLTPKEIHEFKNI